MKWLIPKDLIASAGESTAVGEGNVSQESRNIIRALPSEAVGSFLAGFTKSWSHEIRLYDDDGELYYEGRCDQLDQADQDAAFAPQDWATNEAGCTSTKYRKVGATKWEDL
jgi:hypothetical protein